MFTLKIKPTADGDLLSRTAGIVAAAGHLNATEPLNKITIDQTGSDPYVYDITVKFLNDQRFAATYTFDVLADPLDEVTTQLGPARLSLISAIGPLRNSIIDFLRSNGCCVTEMTMSFA